MLVFSGHFITTGKSSCVNARGIPTTAYQVPHMPPILTWLGRYLPWQEGGGSRYQGVTPFPVLTWLGDTYLGQGGRYLGVPPPPILTWPGGGVPTLAGG